MAPTTKVYKGKDGKDAGFCTVPVKYQFKDRDQKTFAEKTLRETCKVKCSTPYPVIVREYQAGSGPCEGLPPTRLRKGKCCDQRVCSKSV
jgi:hypothetical protein